MSSQTPPRGVSPLSKSWTSVLTGQSSPNRTNGAPSKVSNGTVHAHIPKDLLLDSPPLWQSFVVGHFIGDSAPHIGKVHATVNRLWADHDSKMMIDAHFISKKSVLFKISNDSIRSRVLRRQFWHISDIPMVVSPWSPSTANDEPNLTAIPLWVDFAKVPDQLFSRRGLMFLGDSIGAAQRLHPSTERCTRFDVARVLVEVNLMTELPIRIDLGSEYNLVQISYPWLPSRCTTCNGWGHLASDCSRAIISSTTEEVLPPPETEQQQAVPEKVNKINTCLNTRAQEEKEQRVYQETNVEGPAVHLQSPSEKDRDYPPVSAVHTKSPVLAQMENHVSCAALQDQVQVQETKQDVPACSDECLVSQSNEQDSPRLKTQSTELELEVGEISAGTCSSLDTEGVENPPPNHMENQGGGYHLRNPTKEPDTTRIESKRTNKKKSNIKSSSRKA